MISASYFFFCASADSHLHSGIFSYWYLLCDASTVFVEPIFRALNVYSPWGVAVSLYLTIQFVIYFLIGWIIARLVYPDKKMGNRIAER